MMTKTLKKGFQKDLSALTPCNFFMFKLLAKRLVQFQLFEKLTRVYYFKIEIETVWSSILIILRYLIYKASILETYNHPFTQYNSWSADCPHDIYKTNNSYLNNY